MTQFNTWQKHFKTRSFFTLSYPHSKRHFPSTFCWWNADKHVKSFVVRRMIFSVFLFFFLHKYFHLSWTHEHDNCLFFRVAQFIHPFYCIHMAWILFPFVVVLFFNWITKLAREIFLKYSRVPRAMSLKCLWFLWPLQWGWFMLILRFMCVSWWIEWHLKVFIKYLLFLLKLVIMW